MWQSETSLHRGDELSTLFFFLKEAFIQFHCWFSSKNTPSLLTPLHLYTTLNTPMVNQVQFKPSSYKTHLHVQPMHWPLSLILLNLHPVPSSCQSQSSFKARNNRVLCYNQTRQEPLHPDCCPPSSVQDAMQGSSTAPFKRSFLREAQPGCSPPPLQFTCHTQPREITHAMTQGNTRRNG